MIRVLLNVPNPKSWVGGLNYYNNLIKAVQALPNPKIELCIFDKENLPAQYQSLPRISPPRTPIKTDYLWTRIVRKTCKKLFNVDPLVNALQKAGVDIFSHGYISVQKSKIKSLAWIPDFQHKHLPLFFSKDEIQRRDKSYQKIVENKVPLLLSSFDALADFNKFYPNNLCKTYVLQFVTLPPKDNPESFQSEVLQRYNIHEPFFHIPNQLWVHKNHKVVIEALKILKRQGHSPLVISTGLTTDHRNPLFFEELKKICKDYGIESNIKFLGLISYDEVVVLMLKSVALINPSLFEGWSTTVEEAKSLGKTILLSNINVHIEQSPERGKFFSPHNPQELSLLMLKTLEEYDPKLETRYEQKAKNEVKDRFLKFAESYQDIILDLMRR